MKIVSKIINIIIIILTTVIIIVDLYIMYQKLIKKEGTVKIGGYSAFIITSGSMEPTIKVDDLIIVKEQTTYNEQDIITYKNEKGSMITHRIMKIESDQEIYTKGDNNNTPDDPITLLQIQGKMLFQIKNFGKIVEIMQSPITIVIMIGLIFISLRMNTKEAR